MNAIWTPGPWSITSFHGVPCMIYIGTVGTRTFREITDGNHSDFDEETTLANANLIAAAPDLYEAMEAILSVMKPGIDGHDNLLHVWLNHPEKPERTPGSMARAALAKARGETPDAR